MPQTCPVTLPSRPLAPPSITGSVAAWYRARVGVAPTYSTQPPAPSPVPWRWPTALKLRPQSLRRKPLSRPGQIRRPFGVPALPCLFRGLIGGVAGATAVESKFGRLTRPVQHVGRQVVRGLLAGDVGHHLLAQFPPFGRVERRAFLCSAVAIIRPAPAVASKRGTLREIVGRALPRSGVAGLGHIRIPHR